MEDSVYMFAALKWIRPYFTYAIINLKWHNMHDNHAKTNELKCQILTGTMPKPF